MKVERCAVIGTDGQEGRHRGGKGRAGGDTRRRDVHCIKGCSGRDRPDRGERVRARDFARGNVGSKSACGRAERGRFVVVLIVVRLFGFRLLPPAMFRLEGDIGLPAATGIRDLLIGLLRRDPLLALVCCLLRIDLLNRIVGAFGRGDASRPVAPEHDALGSLYASRPAFAKRGRRLLFKILRLEIERAHLLVSQSRDAELLLGKLTLCRPSGNITVLRSKMYTPTYATPRATSALPLNGADWPTVCMTACGWLPGMSTRPSFGCKGDATCPSWRCSLGREYPIGNPAGRRRSRVRPTRTGSRVSGTICP